jgi:hypothetical protein
MPPDMASTRDFTVLDLGDTGLPNAKGRGEFCLDNPGGGAHFTQLVPAHEGFPAFAGCCLAAGLLVVGPPVSRLPSDLDVAPLGVAVTHRPSTFRCIRQTLPNAEPSSTTWPIASSMRSAGPKSNRTEQYGTVRFRTVRCYALILTTIRAEEVRIPRHAREAVARHERVLVVSHERPAFVIVHPDDSAAHTPAARRGRPLREALRLLADAAPPDPEFADDMEAVIADIGPTPDDPWAHS